jgi:hypothetical protein
VYGVENIISKMVNAVSEVKTYAVACWDSTGPSVVVTTWPLWKTLKEIVKRDVSLRAVTDINKDNISFCKIIVENGIQLRHLSGIKSNFGIYDGTEYITNVVDMEGLWQAVVSNVKTLVAGQQSIFEVLWSKALPADQRINEIEGHITAKYETKVLYNTQEISSRIRSSIESASERNIVSPIGAFQFIYYNYFDLYKIIINKQRKGEGKGIRWITSIYKDSNVGLVKLFLKTGVQVRHIRGLPSLLGQAMNFSVENSVENKYFGATIEGFEEGRVMESLLTSNEPSYIKHFMSIFEEMWKNAVDARDVIRKVEEGVDPNELEPHASSDEDMKNYLNEVLSEIGRINDSHRYECLRRYHQQ